MTRDNWALKNRQKWIQRLCLLIWMFSSAIILLLAFLGQGKIVSYKNNKKNICWSNKERKKERRGKITDYKSNWKTMWPKMSKIWQFKNIHEKVLVHFGRHFLRPVYMLNRLLNCEKGRGRHKTELPTISFLDKLCD